MKKKEQIALGIIECLGLPTALEAADVMLKTADVELLGYEKTGGGAIAVLVRGALSEINRALEEGSLAAESVGEILYVDIISSPHPQLLSAPGLSITKSLNS